MRAPALRPRGAHASATVVLPEPEIRRSPPDGEAAVRAVRAPGRNMNVRLPPSPRISRRPRRSGRGDVGAHGGAHRHEEGQEGKAVLVVRSVEIAVHHEVGELRQAAMPQVHQQEGEVVEHVDRGDRSLNSMQSKSVGTAVEEADVAQMQVAVAAPDPPGRARAGRAFGRMLSSARPEAGIEGGRPRRRKRRGWWQSPPR